MVLFIYGTGNLTKSFFHNIIQKISTLLLQVKTCLLCLTLKNNLTW